MSTYGTTELVRADSLATGDLIHRPGGTFAMVAEVAPEWEEYGGNTGRLIVCLEGAEALTLDPAAVVEVAA